MKTRDTKELIYNEHLSNRPLVGLWKAAAIGMVISLSVILGAYSCYRMAEMFLMWYVKQ